MLHRHLRPQFRLRIFLSIVLSFLAPCAAHALDNNVDPYNLGKGDWIWVVSDSETAVGASNLQGLIDYEKNKGMQWITVKCGDGGSVYSQFSSDLVTRVHNAGMLVFGWAYCRGTNLTGEINVGLNCLNLGADGLIIDAEIEYENFNNAFNYANAIKYCQAIRAVYPNRFLAHAPGPNINVHPTFPYLQFGTYCDAVMPQTYWGYRAITPLQMVTLMDNEFRTNIVNKWTGSATNAIKPLVPIAQADVSTVAGSDESDFVYYLQSDVNPATPDGYHGVSFWDCQEHSADQWVAIGATNIALMTNIPARIPFSPKNRCVDAGNSATFSVRAYGTPPLAYQWRFNGVAIPGATNPSYAIANAQLPAAGNYSVVVTNAFGSTTSSVARLIVDLPFPPLQLVFGDDFDTNSADRWNLFQGSANNVSDFTTNWAFDYSTQTFLAFGPNGFVAITNNIPLAPGTANGTKLGLKITVNKNDAVASQSGVSLFPKGLSAMSNCVLRFDAWINYNGGPGNGSGSTEMLTCGLNHSGTRADWTDVNSSSSDGTWFAVDGDGQSGNRNIQTFSAGTDYRAYQGNGAAAPTALSFANSGLAINGASSGDCVDQVYGGLFSYPDYEMPGAPGKHWVQVELSQRGGLLTWRLNGQVIAQRTNTSAFISGNAMIGYMDPFSSIASPPEDNYLIVDNVRVYTFLESPVITAQPVSQGVVAGSNAVFTVGAYGPSLNYQWRFNSTNIPGANASAFTLVEAQPEDAGDYSVIVANSFGSVTSSVATLTVQALPPLFQDNMESYTSPVVVTAPAITNGYKIFYGADSGPADFKTVFGFDYSAVTTPTTIPLAPHSTPGATKALYLTVNKDATASAGAVNLYPISQTFTGNFALKFDLWINYVNGSSSTEHALFGINHSAAFTNRPSQSGSDGLFFALDGDGGSGNTSTAIRDFAVFRGNGSGAPILMITNNTVFGPTPPLGTQFDNANPGFVGLFPSITVPPGGPATPTGSAGERWISVEVRNEKNLITCLLNGVAAAQYTNTYAYTSGDIMLGYCDAFSSIGDVNNFALFDNIRVEPLLTEPVLLLSPQIAGANFSISFATEPYETYTVQRASSLSPPNWVNYTNIIGNGSTIEVLVPLLPPPNNQQFIRVAR